MDDEDDEEEEEDDDKEDDDDACEEDGRDEDGMSIWALVLARWCKMRYFNINFAKIECNWNH